MTGHGGRRPGAGRPSAESVPRRSRLSVRCRADQRDAWLEAARLRGVELSDVVREYLDAWAERTMTGGEQ